VSADSVLVRAGGPAAGVSTVAGRPSRAGRPGPDRRRCRSATAVAAAPAPAVDRRSQQALHRLSRTHDGLITSAVHPWDIVAGLEAAGVTDALARSHYGFADVFGLADELYDQVPRRFSATGPSAPAARPRLQGLLRGVLYALPVLFSLAVAPLVGSGDRVLLLASLVAAWSWTQATTYLGHRRLGHGDPDGARRVLAVAASCGALLWGGAAVLAALAGASPAAVTAASAQVLYFLASGIVVVLGGELVLLLVMVPGAAAATAHVLAADAVPGRLLGAALLLSVLGSAAFAAVLVVRGQHAPGPSLVEVRAAVPYGLNGAALALLLVAGLQARPDVGVADVVDTSALPVVAAMAFGDDLLRRYRGKVSALLAAMTCPEEFRSPARRALVRVLGSFCGLLLAGTGALHLLQDAVGRPSPTPLLFAVAYVGLGAAMFAAVLLSALGEVRAAACVSVPAAVLVWSALLMTPVAEPRHAAGTYAAGCAVLLAVMTTVAVRRVGNVWVHR
jgi:hypothetical protein